MHKVHNKESESEVTFAGRATQAGGAYHPSGPPRREAKGFGASRRRRRGVACYAPRPRQRCSAPSRGVEPSRRRRRDALRRAGFSPLRSSLWLSPRSEHRAGAWPRFAWLGLRRAFLTISIVLRFMFTIKLSAIIRNRY